MLVSRGDDERQSRALHGLTRSLIANMVEGVTNGYTKKLEIVGVGYQAQLKAANTVALQVGYANQIVLEAPPGVSVVVPDPTHITISGADKQAVGQFAAEVRKVRPPSPTRARASATRARSSAARRARRSGRSRSARSDHAVRQPKGLGVRSASAAPEPSQRIGKGPSGEQPAKTSASAPAAAAAPRPQAALGTVERPRLAVFRSSKHIYAQVINDDTGRDPGLGQHAATPTSARSRPYGGNKAAAAVVGRLVAERAKQAGIDKICFDRRSYKYHGRVQALADAAREAGLQF